MRSEIGVAGNLRKMSLIYVSPRDLVIISLLASVCDSAFWTWKSYFYCIPPSSQIILHWKPINPPIAHHDCKCPVGTKVQKSAATILTMPGKQICKLQEIFQLPLSSQFWEIMNMQIIFSESKFGMVEVRVWAVAIRYHDHLAFILLWSS